jgi:capsular polysaccharide biosynthesis protein
MLTDLTATEFCNLKDSVEYAELHFPAIQSKFRMVRFRDAVIDMGTLFPITPDLKTCRELFSFYLDHNYDDLHSERFVARLRSATLEHTEHENVFVLGDTGNYWHFLLDHLGKTPVLRYFTGPVPAILVGRLLPPSFADVIERVGVFLGVGPLQLVRASTGLVRVRDSFVPCKNDGGARLHFLRSFGASVEAGDRTSAPERIFLRRSSASLRRLVNEAEIVEQLGQRFGFVAVAADTMSVFDQIRLVRNAKILVGVHGSALSNLIFAPNLMNVIELYVEYTQSFYELACNYFGVKHHTLRGNAVRTHTADAVRDRRLDNQDFVVSADALSTIIESILHRHIPASM